MSVATKAPAGRPATGQAQDMAAKAAEAAAFIKAMSNERRLLVLCRLIEVGEASVGSLASDVGLSQSALSQHLALLRDDGMVETRREAQSVLYRISDTRVERLVMLLHDMFCPPDTKAGPPKRKGRKS
jgi:ArsR family transcriptional regulator